MCPRCGQQAPLVYRGVIPYCTACGAPRAPLVAKSVTYAGKTAQVGGTVAKAFGWGALAMGLPVALFFFSVLTWLFDSATVGAIFGVPILCFTVALWLIGFLSGRSLKKSGDESQRTTHEQAVFALAVTRKGNLTGQEVAHAMGLSLSASEELLTDMAKRLPDQMAVDVDDQGVLHYRFPRIDLEHRIRVTEEEQRIANEVHQAEVVEGYGPPHASAEARRR
ncbi:MAG: hypothetical protein U0174_06330 [Polyangiaceae bacterium]